jgi:trigger factor
MKKTLALGLTVVMMAGLLSGCGNTSSEYLLDVKYSKYVKLCNYKGVEATRVKFDVTEDDVQGQIEENLYDYVTYDVVTNRGIETGDYANIDYAATLDGEEAEDYSGEGEDILVGEGYIYPEVEEALVGMKTGEDKTVEVSLTDEYAEEEDVGKKLSVKVTLNEISVENVPEYNEEFVKENTDFETMEEYEEAVKKDLQESKEEEYKYAAAEEIMAYLIDNSEFDGYPQELYDECKENYDSSNEYYASMYGMELQDYLDMFGLDEETQKQEIEENVQYEIVIGAIAQAEKIDCTEQEIADFIKEVYADYGYESEDAFSADYSDDEIGYELIYEKVMDLLYENAEYKEISEEEYLLEQQEDMYNEEDGVSDGAEETLEDGEEQDSPEEGIQLENGSDGDTLDVEIDDSSDTEEE